MKSTSPAERTVMVPPFCPLPLDWFVPPLPPQPAAARATAAAPNASTGFMLPPCLSLRRPRVEGVADPVAEQVERENGEQERGAGEGEEPPGAAEDRGRLRDHLAPARLRRIDADAEKRERRLEQDVLRDHQRRVDDDRRDEVRQDLAEQDRSIARAGSSGCLDELLLAQGEDLTADDAADVGPVDDDDRDDDGGEPGLHRPARAAVSERAGGTDPEREQQDWKGERDVDRPRDERVDPAAV